MWCITDEIITVQRNGSDNPAREKKSTLLATFTAGRVRHRTGRVSANNSKTSELLGDCEDHDGKGTFLFLR
jgi:hypothetical protein